MPSNKGKSEKFYEVPCISDQDYSLLKYKSDHESWKTDFSGIDESKMSSEWMSITTDIKDGEVFCIGIPSLIIEFVLK